MSDGLRLVGFEELSAGGLRERLLARREQFWAGSALDDAEVLGLHDPIFFHQLAQDGEDGGVGHGGNPSGGNDPAARVRIHGASPGTMR